MKQLTLILAIAVAAAFSAGIAWMYQPAPVGAQNFQTSRWRRGHEVLLKNVNESDTITIKDGANTDLGGSDVTLGATDWTMLYWNGSDWDRLFTTDN